MEAEAGPAFPHYLPTDRSGARPVARALLEAWIGRGWLGPVVPPDHDPPRPMPCTVLDQFSGSGTTGVVALRQRRNYLGIELNPDHAAMSRRRIDRLAGGADFWREA